MPARSPSPTARTFATAEVARLLGSTPTRVRSIVRAGLCRPARRGRRFQFTFQDLVVLRTAQGLLRAKVPPRRIRSALAQLTRQLPPGRPLSGVRIHADGKQVVVRDGNTTWRPDSGQLLLSFKVDSLVRAAAAVVPVRQRTQRDDVDAQNAEAALEWFETGLDREQDGDIEGAREAYQRAVEIDPHLADAYVNLGRLVHEQGESREASRFYHLAIAADPNDPIAHYNLAIALEDQTNLPAALSHYQRAVTLEPSFADAHFNLGRLLDKLGRRVQALRHLMMYKKLTRGRR
ncbi:MAG: tetratricopeptide repeat protein [Deltaproteobacteria bacterium]|nr:tetratricopeptide repeat protein [Deltaproteobacteria bacterium]